MSTITFEFNLWRFNIFYILIIIILLEDDLKIKLIKRKSNAIYILRKYFIF